MFIAEMGLRALVNHWEAKEAHIEHAQDTKLDFFPSASAFTVRAFPQDVLP